MKSMPHPTHSPINQKIMKIVAKGEEFNILKGLFLTFFLIWYFLYIFDISKTPFTFEAAKIKPLRVEVVEPIC